MQDTLSLKARATRRLLVCFVDLSTFTRDAEGCDDATVAAVLERYYRALAAAAAAGGGHVVKVIGDGALLVFPPARADDALAALLALRHDVRALLGAAGWSSQLVVKLHCGDVVCGPFAVGDEVRFDVIGKDVNVAARIATRAFALSAEAFRALGPDGRRALKKHTPPVTYIPHDDARPSRAAK